MSEPEAPPTKASPLIIAGRVAGAVMAVMMLGIFVFILRTEHAFDEDRCPYRSGELRRVDDGLAVREEWRRCQPGVEERRWMILREGEEPREFARRRMKQSWFAEAVYRWDVSLDPRGELVLQVRNGNAPPMEVLEAKLLSQ